jgi:hypothetical protein
MKDLKEDIQKARKIALYLYSRGTNTSPWYSVAEVHFSQYGANYERLPDGQEREEPRDGFTRVSDIIDVTFTPLNSEDVIQQAVASLDEEERKTMAELNQKLAEIRGRKAQLLALTHQTETIDG